MLNRSQTSNSRRTRPRVVSAVGEIALASFGTAGATASAAPTSPQSYVLVGCGESANGLFNVCLTQNQSDPDQFNGAFSNGSNVGVTNDGIFFYEKTMQQLKNCGTATTPAHGISNCAATGDSPYVFVEDTYTYQGNTYSLTTPASS